MRILRLLAFVCLGACALYPSSNGQVAVAPNVDERAVLRLLQDADGLPFEFRADIQLNALKGNPRLPSRVVGETLQRLFRDAPSAQYRFRQAEVASTPRGGTIAGYLAKAQELRLDTFSVRARVARLLVDVDAKRTLGLLNDTAVQVAPVSCSSEMVDDPSEYYEMLAGVLPRAWEKTNTASRERELFLVQRIDEITSPVQLAPMARLLSKLRWKTPAPVPINLLGQLDDEFAGILSRTTGSDRELLATGDDISKAIEELLDENRADSGRAHLLLTSLGEFWRKNLNEPRCADIPQRRRRQLASFDSEVTKHFPDQSVLVIDPAKADSAPLGPLPTTEEIPDILDVVPLDLLRSLKAYMDAAKTNTPPSEETRRAVEDDMDKALQSAESIAPPDNGCRLCAFEEKREILFLLFDRAPSEITRERALEAAVKTLAIDDTQELSRVQWLWRVHFLINLARTPDKKQAQQIDKFMAGKETAFPFLPRPGNELILDALARSGNAVLAQYVAAEKLLKNEYILPPYISASLSAQSTP